MQRPDDTVPRRRLLARAAAGAVGAVGLASCSAGPVPRPVPTPVPTTPSVSIPADGVSLAELGFTHGPVTAWSLPRAVALIDRVDQPNQVTMVITSPGPQDVVDYLDRALPRAGFHLEHHREDGTASALIAVGHGWRGSVVGASSGRTVLTLQQMS